MNIPPFIASQVNKPILKPVNVFIIHKYSPIVSTIKFSAHGFSQTVCLDSLSFVLLVTYARCFSFSSESLKVSMRRMANGTFS